MTTTNGLEAKLRPYKLALVEAFGLDEDRTARDMSVTRSEVTFKVIGAGLATIQNATVRHDGLADSASTVTFEAKSWNESQQKAVSDYIVQFPAQS
jgi:hypothetical protein